MLDASLFVLNYEVGILIKKKKDLRQTDVREG